LRRKRYENKRKETQSPEPDRTFGAAADSDQRNRAVAKKAGCNYAVDVFNHYSTDANASLRAGNNLKHGTFGMAVYCSHGVERTHIDGLDATINLLLAYVLDI
jgi:putative aminopeptidase FrvX